MSRIRKTALRAALLTLVGGVLATGGTASADPPPPIVASDEVVIQLTDWTAPMTIPKFDTNLGILQQVDLTWSAAVEGEARIENRSPSPVVITAELAAVVELDTGDPTLGVAGKLTVRPSQSQLLPVGPFDGVRDFGGTSGRTFPGLAASRTLETTITSPASMQRFAAAGGGTVTMDAIATAQSRASGSGNMSQEFDTSAGAKLTVAYRYLIPSIEIQKTPNDQAVNPGDEATFQITVTNAGDVELTDVNVTDDVAPNCNKAIGTLAPGASTTYTCGLAGITQAIVNVAKVSGTAIDLVGGNRTLRKDDDAAVKVTAPAIDIEKTASPTAVPSGGKSTFTLVVTNTGDVDLTDVVVTDPDASACARTIGALAKGAAATITCEVDGIVSTLNNTASVTGKAGNATVRDSDDATVTVLNGTVDIEKFVNGDDADTAPGVQVPAGTNVTFTFVVTNTGPTALTDVAVNDDKLGAITCPKTTLAVGEQMNCTPVTAAAAAGTVTNVATVTAKSGTAPVTDRDPANHTGLTGGIDIEKLINGDDADTAPGVQVPTGTDVTVTFVVTNTGPTTLTDVAVNDDKLGAITCPKTTLAVGEQMNCSPVTVRAISGTVTNVATVTANSGTTRVTDADAGNHTGTTPPPPPVTTPCPADGLLTGLRFEVNGGVQVASSLSQLNIESGDTVSMIWTGTRAGGENCDVSLALYKAHTPTFSVTDEQRLLASVRCFPGTTQDCLQPNGERRISLVVVPEPDCPYQLDAVTGAPLATVGPVGGFYSAILSRATNRLISAIYVPLD